MNELRFAEIQGAEKWDALEEVDLRNLSLQDAVDVLDFLRNKESSKQNQYREHLNAAFRIFWASNPSEEEFARRTNRLVLTPEMLFIMVKSR